ncbi:hypothetical protein [Actinoplanes sp. NPDC051851]|uniref:hypothetical protein n=1 Tax=Actinoplanes sp. NPDC051851 TaxID=3154753 RepID=UPI00344410D0
MKHTPEILARAAVQANSVAGVLRILGLRQSGGMHAHISRRLKQFGIDTSHFRGAAHNRGDRDLWTKPVRERLDNRPRNLRFLCPNCHSQTSTYAGSRRGGSAPDDVVYDDTATTPTGFPLGRRLPRRQEWPWDVYIYAPKGP